MKGLFMEAEEMNRCGGEGKLEFLDSWAMRERGKIILEKLVCSLRLSFQKRVGLLSKVCLLRPVEYPFRNSGVKR